MIEQEILRNRGQYFGYLPITCIFQCDKTWKVGIFLGHNKEYSFVYQSVPLTGGPRRKDKHRRQSQGFGQSLTGDGASPWRRIAILGLNEQQGHALVYAVIEPERELLPDRYTF